MRHLLWVWVTGSLALGTVALLFVQARVGGLVLQPVVDLGPSAFLVLLLVVVAAVTFAVLSGRVDSWLTGHRRGRALWSLVVFVGGLAGWGYAATVVLALDWAPWLLVTLAYVGGGLPFTLVAATLVRSTRPAALALGVSLVLLFVGALLVIRPGVDLLGVVRMCADNLALLLGQQAFAF